MMKALKTGLFMLSVFLLSLTKADAQVVAAKTNFLYWGTTTPNLSLEFGLGKRTTLDLMGGYNPFTFGSDFENKKLQHWVIQPELRLWKCERFNRGFWGFHAHYGQFNMGGIKFPMGIFKGLRDHRYDGWGVGGGVSYGWQWYLGPHWNLEATFGFGYAYLEYDRYESTQCGDCLGKGYKHYWGPTKIGVSIVYLFKSKR